MKTVIEWEWEEAFEKFGFGDGDGPNFTDEVAEYLEELGYKAECGTAGMHNYMIFNLYDASGKDVLEGMGQDDNIREILPEDVVAKLDSKFPKELEEN